MVILESFLINFLFSNFCKFFTFLTDFKSSEGLFRFFLVGVKRIFFKIDEDLGEQGIEAILIVEFFSAVNVENYWFEGRKYREGINPGEFKRGI